MRTIVVSLAIALGSTSQLAAQTMGPEPESVRPSTPAPAPLVLQSRSSPSQTPVQAPTQPAVQPAPSPAAQPANEARSLGLPTPVRPAQSSSTTPTTPGTLVNSSLQMLVSLAAVVGVAFAVLAMFRKLARRQGGLSASLGAAGRAPSGVLEVLARYPVSSGVSLVLLKIDRRILLLSQSSRGLGRGAGSGGFTTLCEITDPEEVASILVKTRDEEGDSIAAKFNGLLRQADTRMDAAAADRAHDTFAAPLPEPTIVSRPARSRRDDPAAAIEAMRDQIPVVDLTQRPSPRVKPSYEDQLGSIKQRLAQAQAQAQAQTASPSTLRRPRS